MAIVVIGVVTTTWPRLTRPMGTVLVLNVYGITRNTHDRGDIESYNMAMLGALGIPGMGQVRVHVQLCVCDKMGSG